MDNGLPLDEMDERVQLSPYGRKRKRNEDSWAKNVAKNARYNGQEQEPSITCKHNTHSTTMCKASSISVDELTKMHDILYSNTDKVKQDTMLLSFMQISDVKRRTSKSDTPMKRNTSVKYFVLNESREQILVCKEAFMGIFCKYFCSGF